eukprot:TRINITY_DN3991_c0_g1_i5.p1 TRINITY_DN3991_c0_g1~~TRINITY_DN3991_c0_g1_i5.p1  ORF type:complete len:166 (-),score=25.57 TRINITY_DN3991_c0_g1_i5:804-1238(-)
MNNAQLSFVFRIGDSNGIPFLDLVSMNFVATPQILNIASPNISSPALDALKEAFVPLINENLSTVAAVTIPPALSQIVQSLFQGTYNFTVSVLQFSLDYHIQPGAIYRQDYFILPITGVVDVVVVAVVVVGVVIEMGMMAVVTV